MLVYGLKTQGLKEKALVNQIGSLLESFFKVHSDYDIYKNNKLSKRKNYGGLSSPDAEEQAFVYDYSYDYFNKSFGVYIQLYSNINSSGEVELDMEDIEWVLTLSPTDFYLEKNLTVINTSNPMVQMLVEAVLAGLPCDAVFIEEVQ